MVREFEDCSVCRECLHSVEGMGLVVELGEGLGEGLGGGRWRWAHWFLVGRAMVGWLV